MYQLPEPGAQLHVLAGGEVSPVVPCAWQALLFFPSSPIPSFNPWLLKTSPANHVAELASRG
jgi:hypothetical protein